MFRCQISVHHSGFLKHVLRVFSNVVTTSCRSVCILTASITYLFTSIVSAFCQILTRVWAAAVHRPYLLCVWDEGIYKRDSGVTCVWGGSDSSPRFGWRDRAPIYSQSVAHPPRWTTEGWRSRADTRLCSYISCLVTSQKPSTPEPATTLYTAEDEKPDSSIFSPVVFLFISFPIPCLLICICIWIALPGRSE